MYTYIAILTLLIFPLLIYGQSDPYCGTDHVINWVNSDSLYKRHNLQANKLIHDKVIRSKSEGNSSSNKLDPVTLPIVVHIIHDNGPENIPDDTIFKAIENLNLRFSNEPPHDQNEGTNTKIQFCLASFDENGNPASGITRDVSELTDFNQMPPKSDTALVNISSWDPYQYINVYVVKSICSWSVCDMVGYAYLPQLPYAKSDGIFIEFNHLTSLALTHEVGHYLGLYHTFNLDFVDPCLNSNCMLDGDKVCDTPPDDTHETYFCPLNSCGSELDDTSGYSPFAEDVPDSQNYMDYGTCSLVFTEGQGQRMRATLDTIRFSLLQSPGCEGILFPPPVANFSITKTYLCGATSVSFFDSSENNPYKWWWDFESDGIIDGTFATAVLNNVHDFTTLLVTYVVENSQGRDTIVKNILVEVQEYGDPIKSVEFEGDQYWVMANGYEVCQGLGTIIECKGMPGMETYLWSTGETSKNITIPTDKDTLIQISLIAIDTNGVVYDYDYCKTPIKFSILPSIYESEIINIPGNGTEVCDGESIILAANPQGDDYYYYWYLNGSLITLGDSALYSFYGNLNSPFTQAFHVEVTDSFGCRATSEESFFTWKPIPHVEIISNESSGCIGDSIVLAANGEYVTYLWSTGQITPVISVYDSDTFQLQVTNVYQCDDISQDLNLSFYEDPDKPTVIDSGGILYSSMLLNNQWYLEGQQIPGATGILYDYTQPGCFSLSVREMTCLTYSDTICVSIATLVSPATIERFRITSLVDEMLNISYAGQTAPFDLSLYDALGKEVLSRKLNAGDVTNFSISVNHLPSGIYFLQITGEGYFQTFKIIIT